MMLNCFFIYDQKMCFHISLPSQGSKHIKSIKPDLDTPQEVCFISTAFAKMNKLRFFIAHNVYHPSDLVYLTSGLKWFEWPGYTQSTLPFASGGTKLCGINMPGSHISLSKEEFRVFYLRCIGFCSILLITYLALFWDL
ncbi:hypothetical protein SAY87_017312 [Trapa incisa]|uniref:Uncharacterized protein n=1 Tax=Trapa incisa TaxID=236973 RepID=A0AAN7LIC2_9MYRT|nr:hypothetical protein SAY87_017312 [Trapa incisa]